MEYAKTLTPSPIKAAIINVEELDKLIEVAKYKTANSPDDMTNNYWQGKLDGLEISVSICTDASRVIEALREGVDFCLSPGHYSEKKRAEIKNNLSAALSLFENKTVGK